MPSLQILAFLVALVDLAVGGLISNGFIIKVIITEWAKCRSLASSDQLLLSLSVSNIGITAVVATHFIIATPSVTTLNSHAVLQVSASCIVFVTFFRFWATAWLSFFYCIKIVNSSHSFFLWCKMKISWLITRLLLGSLIISLAVSLFAFQNMFIYHPSNTTTKVMNVSQGSVEIDFNASFKLFILVSGSTCPLLVVLLCSILVVASLCRHVCQMTGEQSSFRSLQTKVHIKAAGTILSFLLLYVLFCMAQTSIMTAKRKGLGLILATVIKVMNASAQAAILVWVNPKLKQTAIQMLQRLKTSTS